MKIRPSCLSGNVSSKTSHVGAKAGYLTYRYDYTYVPGSKLLVLGMVIQPLIGNPYNGYINPYYWVDDHPLLYGNIGSLDPSTYKHTNII